MIDVPRRSLAQLDADARELVDFTVWNFTAFTKITKKRDKKFKHERPIRERFCAGVRDRATLRHAPPCSGGNYTWNKTLRAAGSRPLRREARSTHAIAIQPS